MSDSTRLTQFNQNNLQLISISPEQERQKRLFEAMELRKPVHFYRQEANGKASLVRAETDPLDYALSLFDTTGAANPNTALHLINQLRSVLPNKVDAQSLNASADLMSSIQPQGPLEGMLAAQMVACHNMAMTFAEKAMAEGMPDKATESHLNRSTKMMRLFSQHAETLHKLRNKGQQTIQVQHVQIGQVQQGIIGNNVGMPFPGRGQGVGNF